jgi:hypothetical protein
MTTKECEYDPDHLYHDHREADDLRAEVERLQAAARRVMKAYAGNDTSEQMKALGALSDALAQHME